MHFCYGPYLSSHLFQCFQKNRESVTSNFTTQLYYKIEIKKIFTQHIPNIKWLHFIKSVRKWKSKLSQHLFLVPTSSENSLILFQQNVNLILVMVSASLNATLWSHDFMLFKISEVVELRKDSQGETSGQHLQWWQWVVSNLYFSVLSSSFWVPFSKFSFSFCSMFPVSLCIPSLHLFSYNLWNSY